VEQVAKPDRIERPGHRQRLEDVGLNRRRRVAGDALRRRGEAIRVEIEEGDRRLRNRPGDPVKEVAGADPDIEMTGRDVAPAERAQLARRGMPEEAVGEAEGRTSRSSAASTACRSPGRP